MKNKIIVALLLILMVIFLIPNNINASEYTSYVYEEGDYKYYISKDSDETEYYVTITKYMGDDAEVVIPTTIGGYPVRKIGGFSNNETITKVEIPDGITDIKSSAFYSCRNLSNIEFPESMKTIDIGAFGNCDSLESIKIPNGIKNIRGELFRGCDNLTSVELPETIEIISYDAFRSCGKLSNLNIPKNVTRIGENAFRDSTNLKNIEIPASVSTIGKFAFYGWTNEQTINLGLKSAGAEWNEKWNYNCNAVINYGVKMPFFDIEENDWYYDAMMYCYINEIMLGTTNTTLDPNIKLTRGMLVTILYRMEGSPEVTGTNKFSDIKAGKYYYDAVVWASSQGIVSGYKGTTNFGPNDYIKRQDLAGMLSNYARYKGKYVKASDTLSAFMDVSDVSTYALSSMKWAVQNNIMRGSNGKLNPKGNATRAEAAAMLYNYCLNIK